MRFEGTAKGDGWGLALMEMLTDPMLKQWVPAWVEEQYTRANPFFREVLTAMQSREDGGARSNASLLRRTKKEMIRRHRRQIAKEAAKREKEKEKGVKGGASTSEDGGSGSECRDERSGRG